MESDNTRKYADPFTLILKPRPTPVPCSVTSPVMWLESSTLCVVVFWSALIDSLGRSMVSGYARAPKRC